MSFIWGHYHEKFGRYQSVKQDWKLHFINSNFTVPMWLVHIICIMNFKNRVPSKYQNYWEIKNMSCKEECFISRSISIGFIILFYPLPCLKFRVKAGLPFNSPSRIHWHKSRFLRNVWNISSWLPGVGLSPLLLSHSLCHYCGLLILCHFSINV